MNVSVAGGLSVAASLEKTAANQLQPAVTVMQVLNRRGIQDLARGAERWKRLE
jgi:hypothetical protein